MHDDASDVTLLEAWCEGSEDAGDKLLRRWFPRLYRFFINKAGDVTDDLVQQTMMGCLRHRDRIRETGAFRLYLFRIARSRLYDHVRAMARRRGIIDADIGHVSVAQTAVSHTSRVARGRAADEIREVLRRLPIDLQLVVEMHYWEDQSTAEIAEVLELPQGTVKTRLRRARQLLQDLVQAEGAEVLERLGRARPELVGL